MFDFRNTFSAACFEPSNAPCKVRLAPTPSGYLHVGNALNFVFNALLAKLQNGRIVLRIDDMDSERCKPAYLQDIFDTLLWLQIEWDEGPRDVKDFESNWSQQHRIKQYESALHTLVSKGLLYACAKSRKELAQFAPSYPPDLRNQGLHLEAAGVAWRIMTPDSSYLNDFVVRKKDGMPAYQLTSIVDDELFKITHIVRGEDLQQSSDMQKTLSQHIGLQSFNQCRIVHHPLVTDQSGQKISKSAGAESIQSHRIKGEGSQYIYQIAAKWVGISNEDIENLTDLVAAFKTMTLCS